MEGFSSLFLRSACIDEPLSCVGEGEHHVALEHFVTLQNTCAVAIVALIQLLSRSKM